MIPSFTRVSRPVPTPAVEVPPMPAPAVVAERQAPRSVEWLAELTDRLGVYLLHAAVFVLLVRPADLLEALDNATIYEALIAACLVASLPVLKKLFSLGSIRSNAVLLLSLVLVPAVMLSHLARADTYDARLGAVDMFKAVLLFVLVIGHVDSIERLRGMLATAGISVLFVTVLALLHFHGFVEIPALAAVAQRYAESGADGVLLRLCGVGVFNDPNDFALILVAAGCIAAWAFLESPAWPWRLALALSIALFGYALYLTHSRGGLLSAMAAMGVFLFARMGWKRALPLALLAIPVILMVMSHRQTTVEIDNPEDTFQTRMGLWSDALVEFRNAPFTGIGEGRLVDVIGQVAHNSFLHAFAEMGLLGGVAFLGIFYLISRELWRSRSDRSSMGGMKACIAAILIGYGVGLLSLSRCYTVPTQFILGMGMAYVLIAAREGRATLPAWNWNVLARITVMSGVFLLATQVFVRVMLHRGAF